MKVKVKCLSDRGSKDVTKGRVYSAELTVDNNLIIVHNDRGEWSYYCARRFEQIKEPEPPIRYVIINESEAHKVDARINSYAKSGWKLLGPVVCAGASGTRFPHFTYCATMVKEKDIEE